MRTQKAAAVQAFATLLGIAASLPAATPTTNPADLERQAVQKMQQMSELSGPSGLPGEDLHSIPLDQKTGDILKRAAPIIELLRAAGEQPTADWGKPPQDMSAVLESLNAPRSALNLLELQARYELAQGEPNQAVDDLLAAMTIGRHIGQRKLLVARLVELGCESSAINALAAMLPRLPQDIVKTLPARLAKVPAGIPLKETLAAEKAFGDKMLATQMAPPLGASDAVKKRSDDIRAQYEAEIMPFYEAIAKAEHAPPEDFQKIAEDAAARAKSLLIKVLAPSIGRMRVGFATVEAREAMLQTAIAVVDSGASAVVTSRDPFGNGPFQYQKTGDGFVLTSALKLGTALEPVSLTVGRERE